MSGSVLLRYVGALERHRRAVLVAVAIAVVLAATSLFRLRLDLDLLAQLPARSQAFRDFRVLLERFSARSELVVLVRGEPADVDRFVASFARSAERIEGVARIEAGVDAERFRREILVPHRWILLDEQGYERVAERLEPDAIASRVRGLRRALSAPLGAGSGRLIAADPLGLDEILGGRLAERYADPRIGTEPGTGENPRGAALVVIEPTTSTFDVPSAELLMAQIRAAEEDTRRALEGTSVEVGYTGGVVYALADKRRLQGDLSLAFLVTPALVVLAFALGLRDRRALPRVLASLVAVTALTFAASLLLYDRLNMISIAFAGIFFGLGIDSGIYLLSALAARPAGEARVPAVAAALATIGPANVLASLTSAAVFFLIGASQFTGVAQLGVLSGVAMIGNVGATFVLLPALLLGGATTTAKRGPGLPSRAIASWVEAGTRRHRGYTFALALLAAALLWPATRARLETDFSALRPDGGEAAAVESAIVEAYGSLDVRGAVIVRARTLDAAAERTEEIVATLERHRREGLVGGYASLTTFVPAERTRRRRAERFEALPRDAAAATLERELAEQGFRLEPFRPFLRELRGANDVARAVPADLERGPLAPIAAAHLDREGDEVALATFVAPAPGRSFVEIADLLRDEIDDRGVVVTGRAVAERELHRILRFELSAFLGGALALNFLLLSLAERSARRAGVLLAPTLLGLLGTFALLGALGVAIDPVNLIVLPLLVGLGVDHGVYFAAHAREGGSLAEVVARGLRPFAIVVVTTVAAFAALAFADYPALAGLGRAGAAALVLAALGTLVSLPLLVAAFRPRGWKGE